MSEEEAGKIVRDFYRAAQKTAEQNLRGVPRKTALAAEARTAKRLMDELTGTKRPRTEQEIDAILGW